MSQLVPVLALAIFVVCFGSGMLFLISLTGAKGIVSQAKDDPYECGVPSEKGANRKVPIKFYLTAILFILFDIEIIFMYPWALTFGDFITAGHGLYVFAAMALFVGVFVFGLFWEVRSKALEWD